MLMRKEPSDYYVPCSKKVRYLVLKLMMGNVNIESLNDYEL